MRPRCRARMGSVSTSSVTHKASDETIGGWCQVCSSSASSSHQLNLSSFYLPPAPTCGRTIDQSRWQCKACTFQNHWQMTTVCSSPGGNAFTIMETKTIHDALEGLPEKAG